MALDDFVPEVLALVCKPLGVNDLVAASAVASDSTLAAAAREKLAKKFVVVNYPGNAIGLAWAAELSLASGISLGHGRIGGPLRVPARAALRYLLLADLLRLLQSDRLWVADEEDRYKAAAAWLRCWRWWALPSSAASTLLAVIRPERMAPCARQRAYEDAAQWPEARDASWPQPSRVLLPRGPTAGKWTFGFSVPLPARARRRDLGRDDTYAEEQEDSDENDSDDEEEEAQVRFVWGSPPLWVAGAYLHAEVSARGDDDEVTVGLSRIHGAEPQPEHPLGIGPGRHWVNGA